MLCLNPKPSSLWQVETVAVVKKQKQNPRGRTAETCRKQLRSKNRGLQNPPEAKRGPDNWGLPWRTSAPGGKREKPAGGNSGLQISRLQPSSTFIPCVPCTMRFRKKRAKNVQLWTLVSPRIFIEKSKLAASKLRLHSFHVFNVVHFVQVLKHRHRRNVTCHHFFDYHDFHH